MLTSEFPLYIEIKKKKEKEKEKRKEKEKVRTMLISQLEKEMIFTNSSTRKLSKPTEVARTCF